MICSSVNRARFICPSLFQGRTLNPRGGKSQWQGPAPERPALAFKRPSERGGPAAKQDGAPAIGGAAARGEQNAMADRRHRQAGLKEWDAQRLQDIAFEVFAHSPRMMAAGEQQAVEAVDTQLPPGKRG